MPWSTGVHSSASDRVTSSASGHRSSDVILRVGDTLPAHSTSIGKALLAHAPHETVQQVLNAGLTRLTPRTVVLPGMFLRQLATVAEQGYAVNDEETHTGVVSVAAPVFDAYGDPRARPSADPARSSFRGPRELTDQRRNHLRRRRGLALTGRG